MSKIFLNIVWQTFLWVALFGGLLGLAMGLLLLLRPQTAFRISEVMNRWISTRQAMRPLDNPISVERAIYRSHRLIGLLLLAGALFTLYVLLVRLQGPELVWIMRRFFGAPVALWLANSVRAFFVVVNVAAALIALAMIVRPSALKGLEAWANRQYSGRRAMRAWEIPRQGIDPLVQAHPRLMGAVLLVAGLFIVITLGYARFILGYR
ncbi:MAG: hypothetical protein ACT4P4_04785 [Betaproteobacteria bacterium]